jgi:hypothetical protein
MSTPLKAVSGMTSRYHFVTYIEHDDPGDVTTGVADRVPINAAIERLRDGAKVNLTDEAARYRLFYARGALVDAEPASPELAALEMAIADRVLAAMMGDPQAASRCDVCGRESVAADSIGKRCGAQLWDEHHLWRMRELAREDFAAGRNGATVKSVEMWDQHDGRCRGVMTAKIGGER